MHTHIIVGPQDYGYMFIDSKLTHFLDFPLSEFQQLFLYYHQYLWNNHKLEYFLTVLAQHQTFLMQHQQYLYYIKVKINVQVSSSLHFTMQLCNNNIHMYIIHITGLPIHTYIHTYIYVIHYPKQLQDNIMIIFQTNTVFP